MTNIEKCIATLRRLDQEASAIVKLSCGRHYLEVAGIVVAMEGDRCRDSSLPESVMPPIPQEELRRASIGGKPCTELPMDVVRFFRGDDWTPQMLEYVAAQINTRANLAPNLAEMLETAERALSEAPHESNCDSHITKYTPNTEGKLIDSPLRCTCWKAAALAELERLAREG